MNNLNTVTMIGRLTRDPELRQTGNGTSFCRFGLANNRSYKAGNEKRDEVSFFNVTCWGRLAEVVNQYARKGKSVAIKGRLQQRSWEDKDGKRQSSVDIVADEVHFLGGHAPEADEAGEQPAPEEGGQTNEDDSIPF